LGYKNDPACLEEFLSLPENLLKNFQTDAQNSSFPMSRPGCNRWEEVDTGQ
jgi:hypothetical protein